MTKTERLALHILAKHLEDPMLTSKFIQLALEDKEDLLPMLGYFDLDAMIGPLTSCKRLRPTSPLKLASWPSRMSCSIQLSARN